MDFDKLDLEILGKTKTSLSPASLKTLIKGYMEQKTSLKVKNVSFNIEKQFDRMDQIGVYVLESAVVEFEERPL